MQSSASDLLVQASPVLLVDAAATGAGRRNLPDDQRAALALRVPGSADGAGAGGAATEGTPKIAGTTRGRNAW